MATLTLHDVPEDLVTRLEERADAHGRSLNSEVLAALETLEPAIAPPKVEAAAMGQSATDPRPVEPAAAVSEEASRLVEAQALVRWQSPLKESSEPEEPTGEDSLYDGIVSPVTTRGLRGSSRNARCGFITGQSGDRFQVVLHGSTQAILVKPANLKQCSPYDNIKCSNCLALINLLAIPPCACAWDIWLLLQPRLRPSPPPLR